MLRFRKRVFGGVVWALAAVSGPLGVAAQDLGTSRIRKLSSDDVDLLRCDLRSGFWAEALKLYFEEYDSTLVDLVVYIPAAGPASLRLVRETPTDEIQGADDLYVVVFSDVAPPGSRGGPLQPHLAVSIRSLQHTKDPFLTAVVKSLGKAILATVPTPDVANAPDSTVDLTLENVGERPQSGPMYSAMGRLKVGLDTRTRVSIRPINGFDLPVDRSLHYQFRNSDASSFGVSLGAGVTFNAPKPAYTDTTLKSTDVKNPVNAYLLGQLYLDRPHLPTDVASVGLVFGTNLLGGSLLDDVVLGLSVGRWSGVGLVVGFNGVKWSTVSCATPLEDVVDPCAGQKHFLAQSRRYRPFLAFDFAL